MKKQITFNPTKFQELKDYVNSPEFDLCSEKAYRGNKSAITKLRVGLSKTIKLAKETRAELLSVKENLAITNQ